MKKFVALAAAVVLAFGAAGLASAEEAPVIEPHNINGDSSFYYWSGSGPPRYLCCP